MKVNLTISFMCHKDANRYKVVQKNLIGRNYSPLMEKYYEIFAGN